MLFGNYSHGKHVRIKEVRAFKRIQKRGRFRDASCGERELLLKVGTKIISCGECHRRYERGYIDGGAVIPEVAVMGEGSWGREDF